MDSDQLINIANYELTDVPSLTSVSLVDAKNVSLNFSEAFTDGQSGNLSLSDGLIATNGNPLIATATTIRFLDLFDTLTIVNNNTIALLFDTLISEPDISAFSIQGDMSQPQIAAIDPEEPHILRLVFGESITENTPLTLVWNGLTDIFGNPIPNGSSNFSSDTQAPDVVIQRIDHQLLRGSI